MKRTLLVLAGLCMLSFGVWGQPKARFLSHRVKAGAPITLRLSLTHDGSSQWLFPDSTSSFGAFELVEKRPFPTQKTQTGFVDSAHYVLRTFELDTLLSVRLAVVSLPGDSVFCVSDSVLVVPTEKQAPAESPLYVNTFFKDLWTLINWILIYTVLIASVLGLGVVLLAFGKKIRTHFLLRKLLREKLKFVMAIDALIGGDMTKNNAREAVILWKSFGGRLTKLPLDSYTSAETARVLSESQWVSFPQEVASALSTLDMGVYAGKFSEKYKEDLRQLKQIALGIYDKKVYLLKNEPKPIRNTQPALV